MMSLQQLIERLEKSRETATERQFNHPYSSFYTEEPTAGLRRLSDAEHDAMEMERIFRVKKEMDLNGVIETKLVNGVFICL